MNVESCENAREGIGFHCRLVLHEWENRLDSGWKIKISIGSGQSSVDRFLLTYARSLSLNRKPVRTVIEFAKIEKEHMIVGKKKGEIRARAPTY